MIPYKADVPACCPRHEGVITLDTGVVAASPVPLLAENLHILDIFPDADVCECVIATAITINIMDTKHATMYEMRNLTVAVFFQDGVWLARVVSNLGKDSQKYHILEHDMEGRRLLTYQPARYTQ